MLNALGMSYSEVKIKPYLKVRFHTTTVVFFDSFGL